ncbi:hypothetical protein TWF281_005094 [Arthrobotrys megalospora]
MLSYALVLLSSNLVLQAQAWSQFTNPTICCSLLDAKFPGQSKVYSSTAPEYEELTFYWTPTAQQLPRCVFTPYNTQDVSKAVKLFTRKNCQFAIRSGGHSYNPGWAGIENGILMSLGYLNQTTYNPTTQIATVGGGSRWTDVYGALLPYNVTVLGGRNSDLGVGGYLTGGGISFYANEKGWAADNIESIEIVLADGKVINVSRGSNQHPELFRSLKGGSNNFGVITKFRLGTVDATGLFNGWYMRYPFASTNAYLAAATSYCNGGVDTDTKSHIIFSASIVGTNDMTNVALMAYNGALDPLNPPNVLSSFFDGTVANPTFQWFAPNGTIKSATDGLRDAQGSGNRYTMTTVSIHVDLELLKTLRQAWLNMTTMDLRVKPGFLVQFAFQPVSETWIAASAAKGGNSMGITSPLAVMWIQLRWDLASDDAVLLDYSRKLIRRFEKLAKDAGKLAKFRYLNYGDRFHARDIIPSYGKQSVRRMQRCKRIYDPTNVFGRLVPGGFKVPGY